MKKSVVILLVAFALGAAAQQPTPPAGSPPQQKKEIRDPAEYNAYMTAANAADANARIAGFEDFLRRFPGSAFKAEALEALMSAYQQTGNVAKTFETANLLLQADPNNLRGLTVVTYSKRAAAEAGQNPQQNLAEARQLGERGLRALQTAVKPEGMADADFEKFKTQTSIIFNGAVGYAAWQNKDYATAQKHLRAAVDADPNNLSDVYFLALSYLEATPNNPAGFWFVARAVVLSNNNAQILKYGRLKYKKYHGSEDGWNEVVAQAKGSPTMPANFTVAPAPSPAEVARNLANSKNAKEMDFGEWQLILTEGEAAVAERVWKEIKGITVPFAAKVITATKTTLALAATADAIQNNIADVEVTMAAPLTVALTPKPGAEIQIQGELDSYQPKPFLIKMKEGQLIVKPSPKKAPPKKTGTTTRRRPG